MIELVVRHDELKKVDHSRPVRWHGGEVIDRAVELLQQSEMVQRFGKWTCD